MCREMDKIYNEGYELGMIKAKQENALSMAALGLSPEQIAEVVKEHVSLVSRWLAEGMSLSK